jgi:hypothetical protein
MPRSPATRATRTTRAATTRVARYACALLAAALLLPAGSDAQEAPAREWVFGGGTFLTRDRGWNFGLGLELGAALERDLGSRLRLRAGATALTAPLTALGGEPAIYPPYPDGLHHALSLGVQLRTRPRGAGLYVLGGLQAVAGHAGNQGTGVRPGASAGLGLRWHRSAPFDLEGQYLAFDRAFGTTRGVLSVRLVHRR